MPRTLPRAGRPGHPEQTRRSALRARRRSRHCWPRFALLRRRGFDTPASYAPRNAKERRSNHGKRQRAAVEILTHPEQLNNEYQLAEALLEHDEYFSLWRSHHINMVERMVGTKRGTGGSEGVGYLRTTLDKRFFPELWEARTYLSTQHDDQGCPFAKT